MMISKEVKQLSIQKVERRKIIFDQFYDIFSKIYINIYRLPQKKAFSLPVKCQ
jgi:hypothetical protein